MSNTTMLTTDPNAIKLWSKMGWLNVGQNTAYGLAVKNGIIYFADELTGSSTKGDQITYSYVNKLNGIPVGEGGTLDGNEQGLNTGSFQIAINVTRIGVLNPNEDTIEQQRTNIKFEQTARKLLPKRHGELIDTAFFYHAAGANPNSFILNGTTWSGNNKVFVFGHNPIIAPTANRIIRAGGAANDQSLTSSDRFSLDLVDYALEKDRTSDQPLERLDDGTLMLFLSPEQAVDLKQDKTGSIQWYNAQLAAITGGKDNQFYSNKVAGNPGARYLGQYADVKLYEAPRVAYGVRSDTSAVITTVRRAVLMGKDAVTFASPFGSGLEGGDVPLKFKTQLKDYEYYKGIEARFMGGLKKNTPSNGEDVGTIVISTYAAAHS